MTKTTQETGRSMVEMLGVLAVMGVLSVGGISGYTQAMNKHRANNVAADLMQRAMVISAQLQSGQPAPNMNGFGENVGDYYLDSTIVEDDANQTFAMTVQDVPQEVCKKILALDWQNATISPATAEECDGEDMTFTYKNDLSPITNSGSAGGEGGETEPDKECAGEQPACQKCDTTTGEWVADETLNGQACGAGVCTDGTCGCPNGSDGEAGELTGGTCCWGGMKYSIAESDYTDWDPQVCGCPNGSDGEAGELTGGSCCWRGLKYSIAESSYTDWDPQVCGCLNGPDGEPGELIGYTCCLRGMGYNIGDLDYTDWYPQVCGCPEAEAPEGGTPLAYNDEYTQCCVNGYSYNQETGVYDLFSPDICGCPYKDYEEGMLNVELHDVVNCCSYQTNGADGSSWIGLWNPENGYDSGPEGYEKDTAGVCP